MDTNELKALIEKMSQSTATQDERLTALKEINTNIEKYNSLFKEALAKFPKQRAAARAGVPPASER